MLVVDFFHLSNLNPPPACAGRRLGIPTTSEPSIQTRPPVPGPPNVPVAPGALGWDNARVCEWLAAEGLQKHSDSFREQDIDGRVLLELTRDDLKYLRVEMLGDRTQLMKKIEVIKERHEMPDHFMCPITGEVLEDPVIAMDGFTYERAAITTWFQRHDTSPMTRVVIPPTLIPNVGKRSEIANWE